MGYEWSHIKLESEPQRLKLQASALFPLELPYLLSLGIGSCERVVDVGCGDGSWIAELCGVIHPKARLLGLDISESILNIARANAPQAEFSLISGNYDLWQSLLAFQADLVVMRFLHQHLAPEVSNDYFQIVRTSMSRGLLLVLDVDDSSFTWKPTDKSIEALLARRSEHQVKAGGDRFIGTKLAGRIREAGFKNISTTEIVVRSEDIGSLNWWNIVAPVLTSGSDTRDADNEIIKRYRRNVAEARFSLWLTVASVPDASSLPKS